MQNNKHENVHRTSSCIYSKYAIILMARCCRVLLAIVDFAPTLLTLGHLVSH